MVPFLYKGIKIGAFWALGEPVANEVYIGSVSADCKIQIVGEKNIPTQDSESSDIDVINAVNEDSISSEGLYYNESERTSEVILDYRQTSCI